MKKVFLTATCLLFLTMLHAQHEEKVKSKKLNKVESADMTREQRLVHESERKSKKNKPVSMQKKVKMSKKQDKKLKKTKPPKPAKRKND